MMLSLVSLVIFTLVVTICADCPCSDTKLCNPITTKGRKELFVFGGVGYEKYDWSKITTLVWWHGTWDPNITCYAHEKGARVVLPVGLSLKTSQLKDATVTNKLVQDALTTVKNQYMDGVNLDFEDLIDKNDVSSRRALTDLLRKLTNTFHTQIPGSQVTIDVGWNPDVDIRFYDYADLATNCDFLFVMAYDEQSQIFGPCKAGATSHYMYLAQGMANYQNLGISPSQLVMGVPWYGHDFPCVDQVNDTVCPLAFAPWRGASCTDLNALEYPYSTIMKSYSPIATYTAWDSDAHSPFLNYKDRQGGKHQIWYDNAESIHEKVLWAKLQGNLRGVGMYTADFVDYNDEKQAKDFWSAMNDFFM